MRVCAPMVLALLVACDASDGITVLVDLRTDLVPGDEFLAVRTEIGATVEERPALMGQSYLDGRRVAETSSRTSSTARSSTSTRCRRSDPPSHRARAIASSSASPREV